MLAQSGSIIHASLRNKQTIDYGASLIYSIVFATTKLLLFGQNMFVASFLVDRVYDCQCADCQSLCIKHIMMICRETTSVTPEIIWILYFRCVSKHVFFFFDLLLLLLLLPQSTPHDSCWSSLKRKVFHLGISPAAVNLDIPFEKRAWKSILILTAISLAWRETSETHFKRFEINKVEVQVIKGLNKSVGCVSLWK